MKPIVSFVFAAFYSIGSSFELHRTNPSRPLDDKPSSKEMVVITPVDSETAAMEELLGTTLNVNPSKKEETSKLFAGKEIVALYFSASWCPPCQSFSPKLIDFYNKTSKACKFEVVYVSSDRNLDEFQGYFGKMPWLAVPTDKEGAAIKSKLAGLFKVQGIPSLIVLDVKTGNFITDQARAAVASSSDAKALVEEWKKQPAVPISEAQLGGGAGGSVLMQIIMHILKNPVYIFGLLYFYKYVKRVLDAKYGGGGQTIEEEAPPAVDPDEPEF